MIQRAQHLANIALLLQECLRHAIHQNLRRVVGNKTLRQLQRNKLRRLRTRGQAVQHLPSFTFALWLDAMAEHELQSRLMHARVITEASTLERFLDGPSRKYLGDLGDVALRIPAIHAECVQLQQLAAVILVQAAVLFAPCVRVRSRIARRVGPSPRTITTRRAHRDAESLSRVRAHAHPVIQIEQHRWTFRRRHQQVLKLAQSSWPDDLLLVAGEKKAVRTLICENIEVIKPEVNHHLFELTLAVNSAQ